MTCDRFKGFGKRRNIYKQNRDKRKLAIDTRVKKKLFVRVGTTGFRERLAYAAPQTCPLPIDEPCQ
eukprot:SAG11_NODE_16599_length_543_cov_0.736486_1_plen_66_part_10